MCAVLFYPHYVTSSLRVKSQIVVISLQKHPTISWIRTLQALFSAFELCTEIDGVNDWIHQWIGLREHLQEGRGRPNGIPSHYFHWILSLKKPPYLHGKKHDPQPQTNEKHHGLTTFWWFNSDARFEPLRLASFPSFPQNLRPQNHFPGSPTVAVCRSWLDFNSRPCCLGSAGSIADPMWFDHLLILPCFHVFGYPPVT